MSKGLIKYAVLFPSNKPNGGNRVLGIVSSSLELSGCEVTNYYVKTENSPKFERFFRSIFVSPPFPNALGHILSLITLSFKLRKDLNVDCVILSDPIQAILSPVFSNKKIIRYVQSDDLSLFDSNENFGYLVKFIYKFLFHLSQRYVYKKVLFNSEFSKRKYLQSFRSKNKPSHGPVVNPPVFNSRFTNSSRPGELSSDCVAIITSSHYRKGFNTLPDIVANSRHTNLHYLVISQSIFQFQHSRVIYFRPRCDFQYLRALMKCRYILNLSTFEGFGLPLLEGMAMGLVPISVKNEGLNEYYDPNVIKIISSTADFDIAIEDFKDHKISSVVQSGAKKIASRFSVHNFAESFTREIV